MQPEAAAVESGSLFGIAGVDAERRQAFMEVDVVRVGLTPAGPPAPYKMGQIGASREGGGEYISKVRPCVTWFAAGHTTTANAYWSLKVVNKASIYGISDMKILPETHDEVSLSAS